MTLSSVQGPESATGIAIDSAIQRSIVSVNFREVRRYRLLQLKQKYGSLKKLAHTINPGAKYLAKHLGQVLLGNRELGDTLAQRIAECEGQPNQWMDTMGASSVEAGELLKVWSRFSEDEQRQIIKELQFRIRAKQEDEQINQIRTVRPSTKHKSE